MLLGGFSRGLSEYNQSVVLKWSEQGSWFLARSTIHHDSEKIWPRFGILGAHTWDFLSLLQPDKCVLPAFSDLCISNDLYTLFWNQAVVELVEFGWDGGGC